MFHSFDIYNNATEKCSPCNYVNWMLGLIALFQCALAARFIDRKQLIATFASIRKKV